MFPQSGAVEAPKYQVMIQVVPGVLDVHVPEETTFHTQDVVHPGPHLSQNIDHDLHLFISVPG